MQQLNGKTAVITGAGSGFGRELAVVCAGEGMRLVLADINADGLAATCALPEVTNSDVLTQLCDVSQQTQVDALADAAQKRFGAVHVVFNNAGIAVSGPLWTSTLDEWQWTLGVNLMGVVHGVRSFVPPMLEHGEEGHVVNTASIAGMLSGAGQGIYCVSKHGVVALSEVLYHELRMVRSNIGVSVLCPAFAPTGIAASGQTRPEHLPDRNPHPMAAMIEEMASAAVAKGKISAAEIARMTVDAVKTGRFYILPHKKTRAAVEARLRHIVEDRPPHDPMTDRLF